MAFHFVSVAHALREEYGALYSRVGGALLAAGCPVGWVPGMALGPPHRTVAVLLSLIAGGVIANTILSEPSRGKRARFGPFPAGAADDTMILILAG